MRRKRIKEFEHRAKWLRAGVLYHRGKHNEDVKENTIKAIDGAIKDNLGVEIDVRLTKDEQVVVTHDNNLKRIYGKDLQIDKSTYKEIKEASKGEIPLFSEVLKLVNDKIGIMVEIKSNKVGKLEEKTYELLKEYKGRYVIVSFNPFTLKYFRKKDKSIIRGQLSYSYKDNKTYNKVIKYCLSHLKFNFISKPHFISYGIKDCNYKLLRKLGKKGYFIIGWTYKSDENRDALALVYDNMIIEKILLKEF